MGQQKKNLSCSARRWCKQLGILNVLIANTKKRYTTGRDEYPGLTTIEYCSKGHWEGGDPEPEANQDFTVWDDCKDFLPCC